MLLCFHRSALMYQTDKKGAIMDLSYTPIMLYVTGIITMLPGLIFLAPGIFANKILKIELKDEMTTLFVRHWGLLVFLVGALILCSVHSPAIRQHILIAAIIGKAAIVLLILKAGSSELGKNLRGTAVFDFVCVVLYLLTVLEIT
jgi:hypothetical protein